LLPLGAILRNLVHDLTPFSRANACGHDEFLNGRNGRMLELTESPQETSMAADTALRHRACPGLRLWAGSRLTLSNETKDERHAFDSLPPAAERSA
jgi:hypothetical protein